MESNYNFETSDSKTTVWFDNTIVFFCKNPVRLEFWDGNEKSEPIELKGNYYSVKTHNNTVECYYLVNDKIYGNIELCDSYDIINKNKLILNRKVKINSKGDYRGLRLWLKWKIFPNQKVNFSDLRYFAPPALYDKNDLDEDGYEDYFHTKQLLYRDDRLNYPQFMVYNPKECIGTTIGRYRLPQFDSIPNRKGQESIFIQATDIGSMGVWDNGESKTEIQTAYPFYEGKATIGLFISKTVPFGAFWPIENDNSFSVSYEIYNDKYDSFHDAIWGYEKRIINNKNVIPQRLNSSPEKIIKYRIEALNRYYIEKNERDDKNMPAGYIMNCHPQTGEQLGNVIQYGFTGQNILNAYNVLSVFLTFSFYNFRVPLRNSSIVSQGRRPWFLYPRCGRS